MNFEHVEERSKSRQSNGHENTRNEEKHTTASSIDEKHGCDCSYKLDNTDDLPIEKGETFELIKVK